MLKVYIQYIHHFSFQEVLGGDAPWGKTQRIQDFDRATEGKATMGAYNGRETTGIVTFMVGKCYVLNRFFKIKDLASFKKREILTRIQKKNTTENIRKW